MTEKYTRYEIQVKEQLGQDWSDWFDCWTIYYNDDGTTTLTGAVADQAALHGLLAEIRSLGLTLLTLGPGNRDGS